MRKTITIIRKLMTCGAVCLAVLSITSCTTPKNGGGPCAENKKAHMPFITCQPLDIVVALPIPGQQPPKTATFSVKATGNQLTYLWHAKKENDAGFKPVPGATGPQFTINPVQESDFGLYYCVIASEVGDGTLSIVNSRFTSLGGTPAGSGGAFLPIDYPVTAGTTTTICGHTVSGHWDQFPGAQTAPAGKTGVKCQILNKSTNQVIPNTTYYLQFWVNALNTGCMTPVAGDPNWVTCPVTAGRNYLFIAHFITPPPDGTTLELQGQWLPP